MVLAGCGGVNITFDGAGSGAPGQAAGGQSVEGQSGDTGAAPAVGARSFTVGDNKSAAGEEQEQSQTNYRFYTWKEARDTADKFIESNNKFDTYEFHDLNLITTYANANNANPGSIIGSLSGKSDFEKEKLLRKYTVKFKLETGSKNWKLDLNTMDSDFIKDVKLNVAGNKNSYEQKGSYTGMSTSPWSASKINGILYKGSTSVEEFLKSATNN